MVSYIEFDLEILFKLNFFSNLDYFFALAMADAFHEDSSIIMASCALVSRTLSQGHICLDVKAMSNTVQVVDFLETKEQVRFPKLDHWISALKQSVMVSDTINTPLVLDAENRLYFSKYYDFQRRLVTMIAHRVMQKKINQDTEEINQMIDSFFPLNDPRFFPQKSAVKNALLHNFTIISGGPGTGKTFVTGIIRKIFILYAKKKGWPVPKIICAAPTGKAASRMGHGQEQAGTIHSILKPLKKGPGFYYNKQNPLIVDMMIIDEASMIDIPLLTRLIEACPIESHIIILGDQNQLTSIQAGSVFSDICRTNELSGNLFFLEHNFRSKGKTGIENLSKAINKNDVPALESILISKIYPDIVFEQLKDIIPVSAIIKKYILKGYKKFIEQDTVEGALNKLDHFKILCAHNSGEYGTIQINHVCEKILRSHDNFDIQGKIFKKIIMVKTNDYKKKIFNGETGIIFQGKGESDAFFVSKDDGVKRFRSSDLSGFDTAFAMTIHKSQGSEFNTVLIILPDRISPVVTRQLLYTGVTRARKKVIIIGKMDIIKDAVKVSIQRNSGISDYLKNEINMAMSPCFINKNE